MRIFKKIIIQGKANFSWRCTCIRIETSLEKFVWLEELIWSQFYKKYKTYWNGCQYVVRYQGTFAQSQAGLCQN